jgi:exopolysaccharide production protein ExoQ
MNPRSLNTAAILVETSKTELFVLSALLCALFFMATQNFFLSAREHFGRLESQEAADQMEEGSIARRAGFAALGALGIVCLLAPSTTTFRFNRPLILILTGHVLWNSASVLWSVAPSISLRRLILMLCFLLAATGVMKRTKVRGLPWLALIGGGALIVIGLVAEMALGTFNPLDGDYRFSGTMQPNIQGMNCALVAFSALWLLGTHRRLRWPLILIAVVALALVVLTKSRSCVAAVAAAGLLTGALTDRRGRHVAAAGFLLWIVGLAYVFTGDSLATTAGEAANLGRGETDVTAMSGRMPLWTHLMEYVAESPILGYGFGGFWTAENVAEVAASEGWVVTSAHSAYMETLLGTGLPGCFFYMALLLGALGSSIARYRRTRRPEWGFAACILIYCIVHGSMEAAMATVPQFMTLIIFSAVLGLAFDPANAAEMTADRGSRSASGPNPRQRLVWSA